jgi:predicted amidohydrolase
MVPFIAAALQVAPTPGPLTAAVVKANLDSCVDHLRRCVDVTSAELVVLPEAATTGFSPGVGSERLWDLVSEVPGPVSEPIQEAARLLGVHIVFGTYERGPERGTVYNTAAIAGPTGEILGTYRKTHLFCGEDRSDGGWVTPGDEAVVVDTDLARIGLMICFDGDYPELSRIEAVMGAEVICRPSALLRSADIWELTNRARAYDNHVFVVATNATGMDPAGLIYFGNSMIVTPIADVIARAASHEGWVSARLDPATAMASLTPGSNVPQRFDHLADRNLALIERHLDDLRRPARTGFPHAGSVRLRWPNPDTDRVPGHPDADPAAP